MKVKLEKISEWTVVGKKLGIRAYQYAPTNAKSHFARGKEEFVIWCGAQESGSDGIGWIKDGQWTFGRIMFLSVMKGTGSHFAG